MMQDKKVILAILDGWGLCDDPKISAIEAAETPVMDRVMRENPHAILKTSGLDVGLPAGQMGNSEVGHLNIGAGRIVYQELTRINMAVEKRTLESEPEMKALIQSVQSTSGRLHLMGLLSDGGVHSHIDHLIELCRIADAAGLKKVYIHAFLDGRDTDPLGGKDYLRQLEEAIAETPIQLVSIIGRYYAMDRDQRWERTQKAYDLLVHGKADVVSASAQMAVAEQYKEDLTDEFMKPIWLGTEEGKIRDGDHVLFFNFRTDRPRQLTQVLTQEKVGEMKPLDLYFATMTSYDQDFKNLHVIYSKELVQNTLGEIIARETKTQLRIAETEKYPHVTYFFSGGREERFEGESRIMVNSPKVATYDLQPEMSAPEVCEKLLDHLRKHQPDFVCLNFANPDMVGHTGDFAAAMKAVETVDDKVGQIVELAERLDYAMVIIADHGNADMMVNPDGTPNTAHTTNPVPIIVVGSGQKEISDGRLCDIAPTILDLMGIERPAEMTGHSLL